MNDLAFPAAFASAAPAAPGPATEADGGIGGLDAEDFMTLLIAQLQNQDPSEPVSNEALLDQVATMRALQADVELEQTLRAGAGVSDLATASDFLGRTVRGTSGPGGGAVTGVAQSAYLRGGSAYLTVDGAAVPLNSISEVA